jgi:acyl-CoA thioester hydrolase
VDQEASMMNEPFKFYTPVRVRFNETDQQGHTNFGHYLFYFDIGVTDYLKAIGYSYPQMIADHVDMLYLEAHARYLSSSYFDETLNIHTRIGHIGNSSMRFEFMALAAADGRAVAEGHIAVVLVEHGLRRKIRVPERLREAVARFEGDLRPTPSS